MENTTQQEARQMKNLLSSLNAIETNTPRVIDNTGVTNPGAQELIPNSADDLVKNTNLMMDLVSKLSDVYGDEANAQMQAALAPPETEVQPEMDLDWKQQAELDNIYGSLNPVQDDDTQYSAVPNSSYTPDTSVPQEKLSTQPQGNPVLNTQLVKPRTDSGPTWIISTESVQGSKALKRYGVMCSYNNQVIVGGIMMQEAVQALCSILNEGKALSNPKVLGLISYSIQYTNLLETAMDLISQRKSVLNESKYSEAMVLDERIAESKAEAQEMKRSIIKFITASLK